MIGKKGILRFFYKVMMVCYKKLHLWRIPIPGRDKVQADLNRMHPGENPQECVTDYYVTKLTLSAVIFDRRDNACHYNALQQSGKSCPAESMGVSGIWGRGQSGIQHHRTGGGRREIFFPDGSDASQV